MLANFLNSFATRFPRKLSIHKCIHDGHFHVTSDVLLHYLLNSKIKKTQTFINFILPSYSVDSLPRRSYNCGQRQTMNHIADTCPQTKFEGGLNLLHEADDDAVMWTESTATAALAK